MNTEERVAIGLAIKEARTRRGLTTYELAEAVGLSSSTIGRTEKARGTQNPLTIQRIAEHLGISPKSANPLAKYAKKEPAETDLAPLMAAVGHCGEKCSEQEFDLLKRIQALLPSTLSSTGVKEILIAMRPTDEDDIPF